MNYIEATYLLSSDKKFRLEEQFENFIKDTFGEIRHSPEITEVETFFDSDAKVYKALLKVRFPVTLFRHDMYSVLSILYGELIIPENVKLVSVDFHPAFIDHFKGPNFGLKGVRELIEIHHRPIIIGTLKYLNGMDKNYFEDVVEKSAKGGLDIIREDELFFDDSFIPYKERVKIVKNIVKKYSEQYGKNIQYAPFLTGSLTEMSDKIETGIEEGIKIFVINLFPAGFENLQCLADTYQVAFIVNPGYPSFFYENDLFGIEPSVLFGKFIRISGGDLVLIPSPYRNKNVPHHRTAEISVSLQERFENINPSFPVLYGSIKPTDIYSIFNDFGNQIAIDIGGRYIQFKKGSDYGAKAYMDAVECVSTGTDIEECKSINPDIAEF
ncbi:2,3-diketo-5-methylthiopentyl-1-phosphate enolase [Persephonella hydrogeniphila]|uniref:2,3-diketo-5-methylthiopentyl-1-phosphate enolase n=1 Tax=Persephonella hydrogeniphila TaxID=198703 RepID=A0A285NJE2_9AQUI|nr:RuBisCO large subunit C-terminal-like domain-containing protein [Persephonella hydrogeniphila]SNZ07986.1 2,3-diketo-5-methylthiopentyl-1-phosphate enolase [Persephonella hydrogeniphila]